MQAAIARQLPSGPASQEEIFRQLHLQPDSDELLAELKAVVQARDNCPAAPPLPLPTALYDVSTLILQSSARLCRNTGVRQQAS